MDVQLPNGKLLKGVPDGTTRADLQAKLKANGIDFTAPQPATSPASNPPMFGRGQLPIPNSKQDFSNFATPSNLIDSAINTSMFIPGIGEAGMAVKGAELAGKGLSKAAEPAAKIAMKAIPKVDEGIAPVAKMAQKYKIPLSLDEVTGSRALKTIQKAGQDLPFSGQQAFREKQLSAWNKAVLDTIGAKGTKLTPEVMNQSFKRLGKQFDNLGKGKAYFLDDAFAREIDAIRQEAKSTMSKDAIENFENEVASLFKESNNGAITGEKLNAFRTKVNGLMRKTNNYDTKQLLGDLENSIIEKMTAGDPETIKSFSQTKQQYKNLIALEPLVQKGVAGNIGPLQLSNRVARIYKRGYTTGQAGNIGELARIGRELLPELGGSDTMSKSIYGVGAAGGALSHPIATGAILGGNRLFQSGINRNQAIIRRALEGVGQ